MRPRGKGRGRRGRTRRQEKKSGATLFQPPSLAFFLSREKLSRSFSPLPSMSRKKVNSKRLPEYLCKRKEELEKQLRLLDLAPCYPQVNPSPSASTPMLGHTKGNTKSNRKKIKSNQIHILESIVEALEAQLRAARGRDFDEKSDEMVSSDSYEFESSHSL